MTHEFPDTAVRNPDVSGEHERRLATNYLARQASHVIGAATGLGVITVLGRKFSLDAFGTFALLLSLTSYLVVLQGLVELPAIKAFAEAADQRARDSAFSTVLMVYTGTGVVAGAMVVTLGTLLLHVWDIPVGLHRQSRDAIVALAILMFISWPARVFYDTLRGRELFGLAAVAEIAAFLSTATLVIALALTGSPLWLVTAAAATGSLITGLASAIIVLRRQLPYRFTREGVSRAKSRAFLGLSGYFFIAGLADFVIYSLDRTILGAFRSSATVGLYEGPVRAHNLIRDVQATIVSPVLPAAARYRAEGDDARLRDLFVRGSRYTLAMVAPLALVGMILARPILTAWLGQQFGTAAPALTILVGYWLVYVNTSVGWYMLVAVGQIRKFAIASASVAIANAVLSISLAPSFGLNGVVLGTAIPYILAFPFFLRIALPEFGVGIRELAQEVWLPAYSTAFVVAAGLIALRLSLDLATIQACAGAGLAALVAYWSIYYAVWLRPRERLLARTLVRGLVHR